MIFFCNHFNFQEVISFYELFKLSLIVLHLDTLYFFPLRYLYSSYQSLSDIRIILITFSTFNIMYNSYIVLYSLYKVTQCVNADNIRAPLRNFVYRSYLYRHLSVLMETTNRIGKIDNARIYYWVISFYRRNIFFTNFTRYDFGNIHFRTYRYEMIYSSTVYKQCFIIALLDTDRIHRFAIYKDMRTSIFVRESMHI